MATNWRPGVRGTDGTPPPLPVLPQFPGMRGYRQLRSGLRDLGFRHAAELLREPGRQQAAGGVFNTLPTAQTDDGFRVLDGLWFPGRGGLWQRVDVPFVRRAREAWQMSADPRALTAAAVTDVLETLARDHPMGLRRIVLWELCCLLKDGGGNGKGGRPGTRGGDAATAGAGAGSATATTADDVAALGVHRSEARLLAAAVDAAFPADGAARRAAEEINDVWPGTRLRRAEHLADLLPAAPDDHVLAALLGAVRTRSTKVRLLAYAARRAHDSGDARAAATTWLGALRQATDAPELRAGLLRTATALADAPSAPEESAVRAWPQDRGIGLSWRAPHVPGTRPADPVTYAVLRFDDDAPETTSEVARVEVAAPEARLLTAHDTAAPLGRALRYAVLPLRGDRVAGVPRVSAPVLVAPDVTQLMTKPVPGGVQVHWRPHPAAVDIEVLRYDLPDVGAGSGPTVLSCGRRGLVDDALPPGIYTYRVSCGYPGPGGTVARSPGVHVMARVEAWPTPVRELTAELAGDRVRLAWRAPRRGRSTLVPWPDGPIAPGTDISERFARMSAPSTPGGATPAHATSAHAGSASDLPDPWAAEPRTGGGDGRDLLLEVDPPVAGRLRMTAVSVLGDRAVAGPSVVIESPAPIKDLTVVRLGRGRANAVFTWPEPAVLVRVGWQDGTRGDSRRVPRSTHQKASGAVELAVPESACTVTVTPLTRPDAVAVPAPPAYADLPAAHLPPPPPEPAPWRRWWRRWLRTRARQS
ncbi:hypothetical protein [Streptomyces flavofungini]|uniref:hypothetical protein n=1 Tax=Streptomyces flavofungini TaxID=68200 RepID=UPI0025AFCA3D|nr:hypothetical protein [Streptomyces flavofungini]WJV45519.1 hypothetical protein QUY26_08215 [Streptomyces flavofungini]